MKAPNTVTGPPKVPQSNPSAQELCAHKDCHGRIVTVTGTTDLTFFIVTMQGIFRLSDGGFFDSPNGQSVRYTFVPRGTTITIVTGE